VSDTDNLAAAAEAFHDTARQLRRLSDLQGRSYPQSREPIAHLACRLAVAQHRLDALQEEVVTALYLAGADWATIGAALGVSRQAAHKRYSGLVRGRGASTILG
jgi:DNA-directed RNA polymerase specialized sigma24 family protein